MQWQNTEIGYGAVAKFFHWTIFTLFVYQFAVANVMVRTGPEETFWGFSQGTLYNWHKSIGLVALLVAILRLSWRTLTPLPAWAACLSEGERRFSHRIEQVLYAAMLVMPVSGYLYVMAGGYGVMLFGAYPLPNPVGKEPVLAWIGKWTHVIGSYALLAAVAAHIGLMLKHQVLRKDGLIGRMLP
jgi:cytochrome b561